MTRSKGVKDKKSTKKNNIGSSKSEKILVSKDNSDLAESLNYESNNHVYSSNNSIISEENVTFPHDVTERTPLLSKTENKSLLSKKKFNKNNKVGTIIKTNIKTDNSIKPLRSAISATHSRVASRDTSLSPNRVGVGHRRSKSDSGNELKNSNKGSSLHTPLRSPFKSPNKKLSSIPVSPYILSIFESDYNKDPDPEGVVTSDQAQSSFISLTEKINSSQLQNEESISSKESLKLEDSIIHDYPSASHINNYSTNPHFDDRLLRYDDSLVPLPDSFVNSVAPVTDCSDDKFISIINDVRIAITQGIYPILISQGSSGSYFCRNTKGEIVGVFKPKDEEPYGNMNPKWTKWVHKNLFPCCFGRSCIIPNLGYASEAAASYIDRRLKLNIVPRTEIVKLAAPTFFYGAKTWKKYMKKEIMDLPEKIGSFQLFLNHYKDATRFFREGFHAYIPSTVDDPKATLSIRTIKRSQKSNQPVERLFYPTEVENSGEELNAQTSPESTADMNSQVASREISQNSYGKDGKRSTSMHRSSLLNSKVTRNMVESTSLSGNVLNLMSGFLFSQTANKKLIPETAEEYLKILYLDENLYLDFVEETFLLFDEHNNLNKSIDIYPEKQKDIDVKHNGIAKGLKNAHEFGLAEDKSFFNVNHDTISHKLNDYGHLVKSNRAKPGRLSWSNRAQHDFRKGFERLVILDYLIRNTDRGHDNWMVRFNDQEESKEQCYMDRCELIEHRRLHRIRDYLMSIRKQFLNRISKRIEAHKSNDDNEYKPDLLKELATLEQEEIKFLQILIDDVDEELPRNEIYDGDGKKPIVQIAAIDNGLAFPHKHPDQWRSYPYGWAFLPASRVDFCIETRLHILHMLTSSSWWRETEEGLERLFQLDKDFSSRMFKKQISVLRGEGYNLVETLRAFTKNPVAEEGTTAATAARIVSSDSANHSDALVDTFSGQSISTNKDSKPKRKNRNNSLQSEFIPYAPDNLPGSPWGLIQRQTITVHEELIDEDFAEAAIAKITKLSDSQSIESVKKNIPKVIVSSESDLDSNKEKIQEEKPPFRKGIHRLSIVYTDGEDIKERINPDSDISIFNKEYLTSNTLASLSGDQWAEFVLGGDVNPRRRLLGGKRFVRKVKHRVEMMTNNPTCFKYW